MADLGLLGAIGEGLKAGTEGFKSGFDMRSQSEARKQAQLDAVKARKLQALMSGYQETETGDFMKTPEQLAKEEKAAIGGLLDDQIKAANAGFRIDSTDPKKPTLVPDDQALKLRMNEAINKAQLEKMTNDQLRNLQAENQKIKNDQLSGKITTPLQEADLYLKAQNLGLKAVKNESGGYDFVPDEEAIKRKSLQTQTEQGNRRLDITEKLGEGGLLNKKEALGTQERIANARINQQNKALAAKQSGSSSGALSPKEIQKQLSDYTKRTDNLTDQGITAQAVNKALGFDLSEYDPNTHTVNGKAVDAPGFSLFGRRVGTREGQNLEALAQKIFSTKLLERSGSTVTNRDLENLNREFQRGAFNTEEQLLAKMQEGQKIIAEHNARVEASFDPSVIELAKKRGMKTTQDYFSGYLRNNKPYQMTPEDASKSLNTGSGQIRPGVSSDKIQKAKEYIQKNPNTEQAKRLKQLLGL